MKGAWSVFLKEAGGYARSPMAYVMAFVFLIICGYFFQQAATELNQYSRDYPMRVYQIQTMQEMGMDTPRMPPPPNIDVSVIHNTFSTVSFMLTFIIPILTMRTFAEEYRSGTIEMLWTSPVSSGGILAGKYLAALALYAAILALTLLYVILAFWFTERGAGPDTGLLIGSYTGLFLLGAAAISVGVLASSLTENQIISAVISFSILLFFVVIGAAGSYVGSYKVIMFLQYLSISGHVTSFLRGLIDLRSVVYYLTFIGFMLFLTNRVLESRRWRA